MLDVKNYESYDYLDVTSSYGIFSEEIPKHSSSGEEFPGFVLMGDVPKLKDSIFSMFLVILLVSVVCSVISVAFREGVRIEKVKQFISSHFCFILVGVIMAGMEWLIVPMDKIRKEDQIQIDGETFQTVLIPLVFDAVYTLYHQNTLRQVIPILTFSLLINILILPALSFLVKFIAIEFQKNEVSFFTQPLMFSSVSNFISLRAAFSVFEEEDGKRYLRYFYLLLGFHFLSNIVTEEIQTIAEKLDVTPVPTVFHVLPVITITLLKIPCSGIVGVVSGLLTVFMSRYTRRAEGSKYYEVYVVIFGILFSYFLSSYLVLQRTLGALVCGLIQMRYMFPNLSSDNTRAVKLVARTLSLSLEQLFYVFVGYKLIFRLDLRSFKLSIITLVFSCILKSLLTFIVASIYNWTRLKKIGIHVQALLVFGSLRGPRCIVTATQIYSDNDPIGRNFLNSQFFLIALSTVFDSIIAKLLVREILHRPERHNSEDLPARSGVMEALCKWLKSREKKIYKFLVE